MTALTYFTATLVIAAAMVFAQSSPQAPSSDASNSAKSGQSQNGSASVDQSENGVNRPGQAAGTKPESQPTTPDTTIRDQQGSTTATTGADGQSNSHRSHSMGTTGSTPGTDEPQQKGNHSATTPEGGSSPDQQPNSTTSPASPPPQAAMFQTPGTRAMATHTPDPGTCMNPAAFNNGLVDENGQPQTGPHCN
jgi:hypothetical protein